MERFEVKDDDELKQNFSVRAAEEELVKRQSKVLMTELAKQFSGISDENENQTQCLSLLDKTIIRRDYYEDIYEDEQ